MRAIVLAAVCLVLASETVNREPTPSVCRGVTIPAIQATASTLRQVVIYGAGKVRICEPRDIEFSMKRMLGIPAR
jgi:hypothetical protein